MPVVFSALMQRHVGASMFVPCVCWFPIACTPVCQMSSNRDKLIQSGALMALETRRSCGELDRSEEFGVLSTSRKER